MLKERTARILRLLVDNFLATGEPVGSRTLSKAGIEASPATIRNEMADLEEEGFVAQPHTSAGRVPTDKGIRFWMDNLRGEDFSLLEQDQAHLGQLEEQYLRECRGLDELIHNAVKMLAKISEFASLAVLPTLKDASKARIQLIGLDRMHIMVVLISESGLASSHVLAVENALTQEELNNVSRLFNDNYSRASIRDLLRDRLEAMRSLENKARQLARDILDRLEGVLVQAERELFYDGLSQVFLKAGQGQDEKIQGLVHSFSSRDYLVPLLGDSEGGTLVRIGSETNLQGLEDFSVVTTGYHGGTGLEGTIGILGPKRMDYRRIVGVVNHMKRRLEDILG